MRNLGPAICAHVRLLGPGDPQGGRPSRVCPLYEKVQGMAIGGPSSLGAAVRASDQRYLAVAFEHEENLVEVAQDGAVLSPFALAQCLNRSPQCTCTTLPRGQPRGTTNWPGTQQQGRRCAQQRCPLGGLGNEEDVPRSRLLKMHL